MHAYLITHERADCLRIMQRRVREPLRPRQVPATRAIGKGRFPRAMTRVLAAGLWAFLALTASPAAAREACWSGWGYFVAPESLAFRSERLLLATDGPADWVPGARIALYPLDPETGQRVPGAEPIVIRPRQPSFASRNGNRTVDDVATVPGRELGLMLGMTRIGPASAARSQRSLAWACGRGG